MKKTILFSPTVFVIFLIAAILSCTGKASNERPQEPSKPYPYLSEEVTFENTTANLQLAGTLTLPNEKGPFPAVILISGSGPQNRNEEVNGHKPFLVISDYLTRKGIAVLRFDDRGTAQSTGDYKLAHAADFATDVKAALQYLKTRKEINKNEIGLVGHSEGGIVAPMVASTSEDVSFIVLLAGLGIKGSIALTQQSELILKNSGASEAEIQDIKEINADIAVIMAKRQNTDSLKADLTQYMQQNVNAIPTHLKSAGITEEQFIAGQINFISSPAYQFIWNYDPAPVLEKVTCPVLALNGEKDWQVLPEENLEGIGHALQNGNNENVTIKELPNLNHFFQECKTGSPAEYASIEQTFSPTALEEISNWILKQVE